MKLLDRIVAIIAAQESAQPTPKASRSLHALLVFIPTSPQSAGAEPRTRSRERAPAPPGAVPDLRVLQERLARAMVLQHAGRFEGVAPVDSGILLSFSGPNADRLGAVALPLLRSARLPAGSMVTRRFGAPGAREVHTALGA